MLRGASAVTLPCFPLGVISTLAVFWGNFALSVNLLRRQSVSAVVAVGLSTQEGSVLTQGVVTDAQLLGTGCQACAGLRTRECRDDQLLSVSLQ